MVRWKGDIEREECGAKAHNLDKIDNLNVPNFFVLTRNETREIAESFRSKKATENVNLSEDVRSKLKDAYKEVDMSSEVRTASGPARNLVGNQRKGSRVSVRVSDDRDGEYDCELNVGSSEIEDALKRTVRSYVEKNDDSPAIIFQRMIEPEASGAVILNYTSDKALLEAVKGLGSSLEEGRTVPEIYLVGEKIVNRRIPEKQREESVNPMTGESRTKEITRKHGLFSDSEVESLVNKVRKEAKSIKFVYKRGTFYVVDVFDRAPGNASRSLEGISVTDRKVEGDRVQYSESTMKPEKYEKSLVAKKGGYTSTDAQLARNSKKRAVFSYNGELKENKKQPERKNQSRDKKNISENDKTRVTATEVIELDSDTGLSLRPPFKGRYAVTQSKTEAERIDPEGYVSESSEAFKFGRDTLVLDSRGIEPEVVKEIISYLEAEQKMLIVDKNIDIISDAIRGGFDTVVAPENRIEEVEEEVARSERKILLDQAVEDQ